MKILKFTSIRLSIFYNRKDWHTLIKFFILPFFSTSVNRKLINDLNVHFSNHQGENLRLSFGIIETAFELLDELNVSLRSFLLEHPSSSLSKSELNFFIDFENNSYYYSIYKEYPREFGFLSTYNVQSIRSSISSLILNQFSDESIDDENVLTFYIYLQFVLTKVFFPDKNIALIQLRSFISETSTFLSIAKQVDVDFKSITILNNNKKILTDFVCALWSEDIFDQENSWLDPWLATCSEIRFNENNSKAMFMQISYLMCEQLNLESRGSIATSFQIIYSSMICLMENKTLSNITNY